MKALKWFRFETRVQGLNEPFVDWYEGETEDAAREYWDEDMHRYQIPIEKTTVTIREATASESAALNA